MTILQETLIGFKYKERGLFNSLGYYFWYTLQKRNLNWALFRKFYFYTAFKNFDQKWLKKENGQRFYDLNGAKLPYIKGMPTWNIFQDTFFIHCLCKKNYDGTLVRKLDNYLTDGAYFIQEGKMDITITPGDIVIDAGAWIGDFAALGAALGAKVYAFEPTDDLFGYLEQTAELNGKDQIIPVKMGIGDQNVKGKLLSKQYGLSNSVTTEDVEEEKSSISITSIDSFVNEYQLDRIDFIKADIEGYERNMLKGAKETLKKFAPKLSICTYHLPDDPEVLRDLILEANPNYQIIQLRHKLFAQVVDK